MLKLDEDFLKRMNAPQIDLDEEYKKALKNENFKEMVKELNLDEEILKKYTTNLMECANDYSNCKTCPNIMECKNKVRGYAYLPTNIDNHIEFGYKSCKYLNKLNGNNTTNNSPLEIHDTIFENIDSFSLFSLTSLVTFFSFFIRPPIILYILY